MSEPQSFIDRASTGQVLFNEIAEFVERWHRGKSAEELHEYLGMTRDEYALWLVNPDTLAIICAARRGRQSLAEAVNEMMPVLRMAAQPGDAAKFGNMEAWLQRRGEPADGPKGG